MEINEKLSQINLELVEIKYLIFQKTITHNSIGNWVPLKDVMNWLNYGPTQMSALIKSNCLVVSKIGKRKFIQKESLEKLLNNNIINSEI